MEKYIISDTDKEKVFKELYPFDNIPTMDSRMVDIHAEKIFTVKDFLVIREGDGNFLVSPYYAEAGGTVLDWMPVKDGKNLSCQSVRSADTQGKGKAIAICVNFKTHIS